jgi:MFS family permease
MPAMNNILSRWIPVAERSRSLALVYSGMYLGSVTGLAFSPFLIHQYGWPSVFYSFGSLGTVWVAVWLSKVMFAAFMEALQINMLLFGEILPLQSFSSCNLFLILETFWITSSIFSFCF